MDNIQEEFEPHPFLPFKPLNASILILGSFPGKGANKDGDWYYSAGRNQFWKILKGVYPNQELQTKSDKMKLFEKAGIAVADIILMAIRSKDGNRDEDLIIVKDNKEAIQEIINDREIKKVYFTSHFVEEKFLSLFPNYTNGEYIPSPSPIYRRMSLEEKIKIYSEKLPKL